MTRVALARRWSIAFAGAVCGGLAAAAIAVAGGSIMCLNLPGPCNGTPGNDEIVGTDQADQIRGLAGNDSLDGNDGDDLLAGGKGRDRTDGDGGDDRHQGGPGRDDLTEFGEVTSGGRDVMLGGPGGDVLDAGADGDVLRGGAGNERFPDDTVPRGVASCFRGFCAAMFGGDGKDRLFGGRGKDHLAGEAGRDQHYGGKGRDVIDATKDDNGKRDRVFCGPGRDVVFANPEDVVAGDCERVRPAP